MIIVTPIFIKFLGIENYGLWVLINSIVSSLAIFNFGVTDVIIKYISKAIEDNNDSLLKKTFSTVFIIQLLVAFVITSLCFSIIFLLENTLNISDYKEVILVAIPVFFFKQFEQSIFAFFKAHEEYDYVALFSFISKFFFFAFQAFAAIYFQSILAVFISALTTTVIVFFIEIIFIKKIHSYISFISNFNYESLKKIYAYGLWNWLSSLISIMTVHVDKWIITSLLGLKIFGYYSIGILLFNQIHTVLASSVSWIFPKIAKEKLNFQKSTKIFYQLTHYIIIASTLISLIIYNTEFIFELWIGKNSYSESEFYIKSFMLMLPIFTLGSVPYYYILAIGKVKEKFKIDFFVLALKLICLWLFLYILNLKYWIFSFLIFLTFQAFTYFLVINNYFKTNSLKKYSILLIIIYLIFIVRLYNEF